MLLLACSQKKRIVPLPAKDLYCGRLFLVGLDYAKKTGQSVLILSAKYGWITPDTVIEPYNEIMKLGANTMASWHGFLSWWQKVLCQCTRKISTTCSKQLYWDDDS